MKSKTFVFMLFTLACFVAAGVCLIVDMALNQQITWAVCPLLSIAFGWAALAPLLSPLSVKKHGVLLSLGAVTLLILPYLYLLGGITTTMDWFVPVGLPSAIAGIIALWLLFLLFRFAKMDTLYKWAVSILIVGVVIGPVINYFVDTHMGQNPLSWDIFLTILVAVTASAVLGIIGYMKSKPKDVEKKGI